MFIATTDHLKHNYPVLAELIAKYPEPQFAPYANYYCDQLVSGSRWIMLQK